MQGKPREFTTCKEPWKSRIKVEGTDNAEYWLGRSRSRLPHQSCLLSIVHDRMDHATHGLWQQRGDRAPNADKLVALGNVVPCTFHFPFLLSFREPRVSPGPAALSLFSLFPSSPLLLFFFFCFFIINHVGT